ncbi:MAG: cyclic nucleotide-binding domain-containing protein [Deltaproteobacteria bacterium]
MRDLNALLNNQLLFGLSETQLQMLADVAEEKGYSTGETIFREGEMGNSLVIIVSGKADLIKKKKDGSEVILASCSKGAFFGEMTLINVEPRSATIRATEDTEVIFLMNTALGDIFQTERELFIVLLINMTRILSKRLRQTNNRLMET